MPVAAAPKLRKVVWVEVLGEVVDVDLVLLQGRNALVDGIRHVDVVGGDGWGGDEDVLYAMPGLVAFFKEFGEDPTVVGVPGSVQDGDANSSVVGQS